LFDVRSSYGICAAITVFPPPLGVHKGMGTHWLDLPAAATPDGGD
jgi:hypothetical protein